MFDKAEHLLVLKQLQGSIEKLVPSTTRGESSVDREPWPNTVDEAPVTPVPSC